VAILNPSDYAIDPTIVDGSDLADILNRTHIADSSNQLNATRPTYITEGGLWTRDNGVDDISLMIYDGTTDHEIGTVTVGLSDFNESHHLWDSNVDYLIGDIVTESSNGYIALTNNSNKQPSVSTGDWTRNIIVEDSLTSTSTINALSAAKGKELQDNKAEETINITGTGSISGGGNLTTDRTITHLTSAGHKHIPSGGTSNNVLKWSSSGTAVWGSAGASGYTQFTKTTKEATSTAVWANAPAGYKYVSGSHNSEYAAFIFDINSTGTSVKLQGRDDGYGFGVMFYLMWGK